MVDLRRLLETGYVFLITYPQTHTRNGPFVFLRRGISGGQRQICTKFLGNKNDI